MGMILGLHSTSLRLPFSEYTRPALGNTSIDPQGAGSPLRSTTSIGLSSDVARYARNDAPVFVADVFLACAVAFCQNLTRTITRTAHGESEVHGDLFIGGTREYDQYRGSLKRARRWPTCTMPHLTDATRRSVS